MYHFAVCSLNKYDIHVHVCWVVDQGSFFFCLTLFFNIQTLCKQILTVIKKSYLFTADTCTTKKMGKNIEQFTTLHENIFCKIVLILFKTCTYVPYIVSHKNSHFTCTLLHVSVYTNM